MAEFPSITPLGESLIPLGEGAPVCGIDGCEPPAPEASAPETTAPETSAHETPALDTLAPDTPMPETETEDRT